jgi:hypothetical protein
MSGGMGLTARKREVRNLRDLEGLITENADSIEPGLRFIDTYVLLGTAPIDLVGLDAGGTLVLTAIGFTANEQMLLRALEAYAWCLEYPETVRRLYPSARIAAPRVIFVAERFPDSFLPKARQVSFPQLDCLTFLHLELGDTAAVYFDAVERIRRPAVEPASPGPEPADRAAAGARVTLVTPQPPVRPAIPRSVGNGSGPKSGKAGPRRRTASPAASPARPRRRPQPKR